MLDSFIVRALLASTAVACVTGVMGCFVVWRRMAYFGDATAHAAVLGVAVSLAFSQSVFVGTLIVALLVAWLVARLQGNRYAVDTVLGVIAHSALALGVVAVSLVGNAQIDLEAYLFGDILAVSVADVGLMWAGAVLVTALLAWRWSALLLVTLNPELAIAHGLRPEREQLVLTVSLAVVVAVAIKVVGVLLITAMLIIPAAAARAVSQSPEQMAVYAVLTGLMASLTGLFVSYNIDTPTGPTIVCMAAVLFAVLNVYRLLQHRLQS